MNKKYNESRENRLDALRISKENLKNIDKPRKRPPHSFKAEFGGAECPTCFLKIEVGQTVRYNSDNLIVHSRHEIKEIEYEICNTCFLTLPCECV